MMDCVGQMKSLLHLLHLCVCIHSMELSRFVKVRAAIPPQIARRAVTAVAADGCGAGLGAAVAAVGGATQPCCPAYWSECMSIVQEFLHTGWHAMAQSPAHASHGALGRSTRLHHLSMVCRQVQQPGRFHGPACETRSIQRTKAAPVCSQSSRVESTQRDVKRADGGRAGRWGMR